MKRRTKVRPPIALLWTRRDQKRFIDAVERFVATVGDLVIFGRELADVVTVAKAKRIWTRAEKGKTNGTPQPDTPS